MILIKTLVQAAPRPTAALAAAAAVVAADPF